MTLPDTSILLLGLLFIGLVLLIEGAWLWWRDVQAPRMRAADRMRRLSAPAMEQAIESQLHRREEAASSVFGTALASLDRKISQANWKMSSQRLLLMMAGGFVLLMVALPFALGFSDRIGTPSIFMMVAVVALVLSFGVPLVLLDRQASKRIMLLEQQFPLALDIFVRGLRAGHPVSRSFELLVAEMPDPIAGEFAQVIAEVNYGFDLREAMNNLAERVHTQDIHMFVVSVAIQTETGGNLAEILEGLSQVIRERQSMKLKVRALSSEGKMTAIVLSVLPVFTFVSVFLTSPNFFLDVADDPWFIPGIAIILLMYITGVMIIRRLIDLKV